MKENFKSIYYIKPMIKTPDGTVLICVNKYDMQMYFDKTTKEVYMIDGGGYYMRSSVNKIPAEDLSITSEDSFEIIREHFTWGRNFDRLMNRLPETEWILLKDLTTEHIENIIDGDYSRDYVRELFIQEIEYRKETNGSKVN